jgi:hypothetical protein
MLSPALLDSADTGNEGLSALEVPRLTVQESLAVEVFRHEGISEARIHVGELSVRDGTPRIGAHDFNVVTGLLQVLGARQKFELRECVIRTCSTGSLNHGFHLGHDFAEVATVDLNVVPRSAGLVGLAPTDLS